MEGMETAEQRVKFGKRDDDTMPSTWAERGLTWLHDNRPAVFMDMMYAVYGIEKRSRSHNGNGARP